ncbi:MAG: PIN domain-containing protein [Ginsengibacter sp.]
MKRDLYVLDSCALIAYLRKENGAQRVADTFEKALEKDCMIYIHKATVAEVYFDTLRTSNINEAENMIKDLSLLPLSFSNTFTNEFIKQIGYFKVNYKVSFADCFVLALASVKKAIIISSDHQKFCHSFGYVNLIFNNNFLINQ